MDNAQLRSNLEKIITVAGAVGALDVVEAGRRAQAGMGSLSDMHLLDAVIADRAWARTLEAL